MRYLLRFVSLLLLLCTKVAWAQPQPAKLFASLPDNCPTPDAFAIAPDGSLTLSCPNFADKTLQGELFSISQTGDVTHLATVPSLQADNKANPMGIAYDEDGALYVADARGIKHGRVLKLTFVNQALVKTEVIASGFNPNGLRYHQGAIYVTQLKMPRVKSKNMTSGIYRFPATARNLKMTNTLQDKELIFTVETQNPKIQVGVDGLDFDSLGRLYTTNMGDGDIYQLTLSNDGRVTEQKVTATVPPAARIDGMVFDQYDNLYLAGFAQNQIFKLDNKRKLTKIADYPDNDGSNGQIDQPADLMVYDDKLIISNFDLMKGPGLRNSKHSKPYTLSYIQL
ncbi:SMP-30/gluconolactonase/LRE family protein [Thalassotalea mangrovi]|uniref:SMP-30/Gluconolactonase/LRE-like region domain-containing protein n=1 Tax=Thalassotalea mangrovi TaxID=2572245 RepID=A0A4U1B3E7_9GAMM|nr:SMP-30/gluconolactonase/LRE family protein [Thalassotalea mangrovi]TKB43666.1 hypothetical protein E8M12_14440 [Thalassotalea mangrovi]